MEELVPKVDTKKQTDEVAETEAQKEARVVAGAKGAKQRAALDAKKRRSGRTRRRRR